MLATMPIEVPASRWDESEGDAQLRDLARRISELEDRLYSQQPVKQTPGSFIEGQVYLNANGLNIIDKSGTTVGAWQIDGDVFFGTNVNNPPSGVTIAIFNAAQTYNGESMGVGDMLFGDNSANKASMLWDASAGTLYFRGGNPRTNQVYIGTDGYLYAGNGSVKIGSAGHTIYTSDANSPNRGIKFFYPLSGVEHFAGSLYSTWDNTVGAPGYQKNFVVLRATTGLTATPWTSAHLWLYAANYDTGARASIELIDNESGASYVVINTDHLVVNGVDITP